MPSREAGPPSISHCLTEGSTAVRRKIHLVNVVWHAAPPDVRSSLQVGCTRHHQLGDVVAFGPAAFHMISRPVLSPHPVAAGT
jgi:hypothetical protein